MPKYEVGKTYLFVRAESEINPINKKYDTAMKTPRNIMVGRDITYFRNTGCIAEREFTSIEFKELACLEIRESKCAWGSDTKYEGYIFADPEGNTFAIQYPTASYSQTSDRGDYITSRYDAVKEKSKDFDQLAKTGYFNEYILFSYLMSELERAIKEVMPLKERTVNVSYYKDYVGQLKTKKEPIPDETITVDVLDSLTRTMNYYLSNMPEGWLVKIVVENMTSQAEDKHRFLFTDIIVEKGSIMG